MEDDSESSSGWSDAASEAAAPRASLEPAIRNDGFYPRFGEADDTDDSQTSETAAEVETVDFDGFADYIDEKIEATGLVKLSNVLSDRVSHSFLRQDFDWKLRGTLCVRCERQAFFDVVLTMSEGRNEEFVQMAVCVQRSPSASPSMKRVRFKACRVKLEMIGKFDKLIVTKFVHVDPKQWCQFLDHSSKDLSGSCDPMFINRNMARTLCQVEKRNIQNEFPRNVEEEYEFINVQVTLEILVSKPSHRFRLEETGHISKSNCSEFSYKTLKRKLGKDVTEPWTKKLRHDTSFSDITFKVGPTLNQTFTSHKCVLAARSPVFYAMLMSGMKESTTNEVELPEVHGPVMAAFLNCLYETNTSCLAYSLEETSDSGSSIARKNLAVMGLAHKYEIDDIMQGCVENVVNIPVDDMNVKVALEVYGAGHKYEVPDLKHKGLQSLKLNRDQLNREEGLVVLEDFFKNDSSVAVQLFLGVLFA